MVVLIEQQKQSQTKKSSEEFVGKCQTEYFFVNPVTVVKDDVKELSQSAFAAQIASLKKLKTDNQPFYVMEVGCVNKLMELWFGHLPSVKPYYSVNCNSDPVLLQILSGHPLLGFKCTTAENLNDALAIVPSDRVLYANPCLTRSGLTRAAGENVNLISIQSEGDLHRIICGHPYADLIVNVCVNPDSSDPNATLGCPVEDATELLRMASMVGARCVGIGFDVGSDCARPEVYARAIQTCAELFRFGTTQLGLADLTILDIGGGFASNDLDQFGEISEQVNCALEHCFPTQEFPYLQVIATPGRFFARSAYSLVTSVIDKRLVDASTITNNDFDEGQEAFLYCINEGFYGSFGCKTMVKCEPKCAPLFDGVNGEENVFEEENDGGLVRQSPVYGNVLGPLGFDSDSDDDYDVVETGVKFIRPLTIGDWLIWSNMGAYTMNNSGSFASQDEDRAPNRPQVFYFSTEEDWERLKSSDNSRRGSDVSTFGLPVVTEGGEANGSDEGRGSSLAGGEKEDGKEANDESVFGSSDEEDIFSLIDWPLYDG